MKQFPLASFAILSVLVFSPVSYSSSSENIPPLDLQRKGPVNEGVGVVEGSPLECPNLTVESAFVKSIPSALHYGSPRQDGDSEIALPAHLNGQTWIAEFLIGAVGTMPSNAGRARITLPTASDKQCLYFYHDGNGREFRFILNKFS